MVKAAWKKVVAREPPPKDRVDTLPCEPAAFKKEFPSQWGGAFQSDAPTGCPVSEAAFCALQDGIPMRITNRLSGAEGTPFWESHAEQLPSSLGGHIALANGATLHILSPSIARTPMQLVAHNITALARWSLPPSTPTSLPRSVSSASIYLGAFVAVFLEIFSVASLAVVRCARDGRNDRGIAFVVVCGKNIHVYIYIYINIHNTCCGGIAVAAGKGRRDAWARASRRPEREGKAKNRIEFPRGCPRLHQLHYNTDVDRGRRREEKGEGEGRGEGHREGPDGGEDQGKSQGEGQGEGKGEGPSEGESEVQGEIKGGADGQNGGEGEFEANSCARLPHMSGQPQRLRPVPFPELPGPTVLTVGSVLGISFVRGARMRWGRVEA